MRAPGSDGRFAAASERSWGEFDCSGAREPRRVLQGCQIAPIPQVCCGLTRASIERASHSYSTMPQIATVGYMTWPWCLVGAPGGAMREQRLRGGGGRTALVEAAPRGCTSCDDDEVDLDVELLGCVLPPMPRRDLSTMRSEASATLGSSMQPAPTTCKPPLAKPPLSSASPFIAPHRPAQAYLSSCASSAHAYR